MDEDERGQRPEAAVAGDLPFLPRLCDVLSLRWYSIGDWSATGEEEDASKRRPPKWQTRKISSRPGTVEEVPLSL